MGRGFEMLGVVFVSIKQKPVKKQVEEMKATLGLICLVGCAIFVAEAQTVSVKLCHEDKDCRSPNLYCHTMAIAGVEISTCRAYLRDGNVCMPNITAKCLPKSECLDFYIRNSTYYKTCQKKTEDTTTSAPVEITTSVDLDTSLGPDDISTVEP
ncbi:hypothetical protein JTE90_009876 [Oedothorax gibbosus]|uniref:Uncharacterized protein n=1 Tax=Oedothorax gibbosus TaxID=931172 RepID=A0AAV6UW04_9ARAC|nr:hypothetical protein JTE90_009876 [Oedothorax gibbosus]